MQNFDPFLPDAGRDLIVYLDVKSPYAFIAKDPTRALAAALGAKVDWRPLTLNIPSYLGSARLDKGGRVVESRRSAGQWASVRYAYRDARRYARLQGYTLRGTEKIWDTSLVHTAFLWVKRQGDDLLARFLDDVYERFWRRELDVEDPVVVTDCVARSGADAAGFQDYARGPGREEHDVMQTAVFDAGIFGVPSYLVDGELYFGREHLPSVRWALEGRRGPRPDISLARLED